MELSTFGVVLTFAIELESQAMRFYAEAAQDERCSAARGVFLTFAEEDKRRQAMLVRLRQEGDVSDSDTAPSRLPISGLKQSDYLLGLGLGPELSYADVLKLGIEAEEKTGKFYLNSASRLKSLLPSVSRDFEKLAKGNINHKEKLEILFGKIGEGQ